MTLIVALMWKTTEKENGAGAPTQPSTDQMETFIGHSVVVKGKLTAEESLFIEGTVEGGLKLQGCEVVVGEHGRVRGDISAGLIHIEGEVKGNLFGDESVIIHPTGRVSGDLKAPKVTLQEGCYFQGQIETPVPRGGAAKPGPLDVVVEVTS